MIVDFDQKVHHLWALLFLLIFPCFRLSYSFVKTTDTEPPSDLWNGIKDTLIVLGPNHNSRPEDDHRPGNCFYRLIHGATLFIIEINLRSMFLPLSLSTDRRSTTSQRQRWQLRRSPRSSIKRIASVRCGKSKSWPVLSTRKWVGGRRPAARPVDPFLMSFRSHRVPLSLADNRHKGHS